MGNKPRVCFIIAWGAFFFNFGFRIGDGSIISWAGKMGRGPTSGQPYTRFRGHPLLIFQGNESTLELKAEPGYFEKMKNYYAQEWAFFKANLLIKFGWLVVLSVFLTGLVYFAFLQSPEDMEKVGKLIVEKFREEGLFRLFWGNPLLLAIRIFYINLRTTFFLTILGFVPFLIGAVVFLLMVAVLLGVSLALSVTKGYGFLTFFQLTAPHGVFELIAVIYGASLGVYLSLEMTKKIFRRQRGISLPLGGLLRQISRSYLLVILPLLALAAGIEAFVTPLFR
jgi:stage II sporulation protein M